MKTNQKKTNQKKTNQKKTNQKKTNDCLIHLNFTYKSDLFKEQLQDQYDLIENEIYFEFTEEICEAICEAILHQLNGRKVVLQKKELKEEEEWVEK